MPGADPLAERNGNPPDAVALRRAQRDGTTSAAEIVEEHLGRLGSPEAARLNAVVHVDAEGARAAATSIDERRRRDQPLGALAGIPLTAKDSFAVRGMPASDGRPESLQTATDDAPAVGRLRAADAVLLGKTNLPPLLADHQSDNPLHGRTLNPWNPALSPGGSSGGSAAAVAAGLSVADLGSDLAGSLRVPAAWCGVFAHAPTFGLVSKRGHLPWALSSRLEPPLSRSGPLARSARDLGLVLSALVDPGATEPGFRSPGLQPSELEELSGVRVAVWLGDDVVPAEDETATAVSALADRLGRAGADVRVLDAFPLAPAPTIALFERLSAAEIAHSIADAGWAEAMGREAGLDDRHRLLTQDARQYWGDLEAQAELAERWDGLFEDIDVFLLPAVHGTATAHSVVPTTERTLVIGGCEWAANDAVFAWSKLVNVAGAPATVVPAGPGGRSGMPVGAQLVGPRFGDRTTIRIAELMEREGLIAFRPPPVP